jgi:hypothetical protein
MRRIVPLIAACLLAVFASGVLAEQKTPNRYRWKDAQGITHFDDVLSEGAIQAGYDIIGSSGMVSRHVAPPRTAEQIKADKAAEEKQQARDRAAAKQAQQDQQMLNAYPNEAELVGAHNAQLEMIDQYIQSTQISLQSQEQSLSEMLSHAADLDRSGKPVPAALRSQIESLRGNVEKQKAYIAAKQQEKADSAKKFETELAHYREVRGKTPSN